MSFKRGPKIISENLIFGFDADDRSTRFYPGEPTTNLIPYPNDFTTWTGNYYNNWINSVVDSDVFIAPDNTLTADILGDGYARFTPSITITPGLTYTFSIYLKNINLTEYLRLFVVWGLNSEYVYNNEYQITLGDIVNWNRITWTLNAPLSGINNVQFGVAPMIGHSGGSPSGSKLAVWGGQVEQKSHSTQFVNGTRSETNSLIDLKRTTSIDLSNVSFDSTAHPVFDGAGDIINIPITSSLFTINSFSVEIVANFSAVNKALFY